MMSALAALPLPWACLLAAALPVLLPWLHLGVISHLWDEFKFKVNRTSCDCSCFDTVFKGNILQLKIKILYVNT